MPWPMPTHRQQLACTRDRSAGNLDPDWVVKVQQGRFDEIVACTGCDGCHDDLREGMPVGCTQWD